MGKKLNKNIQRILIVSAFVITAAAGILIVHQAAQVKNGPSKSILSSKMMIPNYRMSSAKTKAAAVTQQPLKKDGIPGKPSKVFLYLKNTYNLTLTPTYDGTDQATHPKLLYFPKGWNGYKYWMSITPYPYTNDDFENPSIITSNDNKTWVVPKGLKNPISGIPVDVKYGGHYSDSQLVMNGNTMELWYRYNYGDKKTRQTDERIDYYYRKTSTDGIHWSAAKLMQFSKWSILSLAVTRQNGEYQFWYTNCALHLMHAVSKDGTKWTNIQQCSIPLPKGYAPWHQDVVYCNNKYYLLQTAINKPKYTFSLFLSQSTDGIHFTPGTMFYPSDNKVILNKTWLYRSTFAPVENNMFDMVISYRLPGAKWFMTQCSLSEAAWDSACRTNREIILKAPKAPVSAIGPVKPLSSEQPEKRHRKPSVSAPVKPKKQSPPKAPRTNTNMRKTETV